MKNYVVEFSKKYEFDFGTRFQTKIVGEEDIVCPITKTSRNEVYYMWTDEPHEEEAVLSLDINNYIIKQETHEYKGRTVITNRIIGLKS